jgi:hypothetical protein
MIVLVGRRFIRTGPHEHEVAIVGLSAHGTLATPWNVQIFYKGYFHASLPHSKGLFFIRLL